MVSKAVNLGMRAFEVCATHELSKQAVVSTLTATQFIWTLLIMALVGNMIATSFSGNPSLVNYDMFVAVFGMLTLFYLIPATFKEALQGHPLLMVALDTLNALFFFCAAVAMAAELHVHSCSDRVSFTAKIVLLDHLN